MCRARRESVRGVENQRGRGPFVGASVPLALFSPGLEKLISRSLCSHVYVRLPMRCVCASPLRGATCIPVAHVYMLCCFMESVRQRQQVEARGRAAGHHATGRLGTRRGEIGPSPESTHTPVSAGSRQAGSSVLSPKFYVIPTSQRQQGVSQFCPVP